MTEKIAEKVQVWVFALDQRSGESLEVLLLQTVADRGGFWQPITGGVEADESLALAAQRELREETGIRVLVDELWPVDHVFEFKSRWGGQARETVFAVLLKHSEGVGKIPIVIDSTEHVAFQWVESRQAFSFLIHESAKIALEKALKNERLKISSKQN